MRLTCLASVWLILGLAAAAPGEENVWGIPLKPDPPFEIDGNLSDWADVPRAVTLGSSEQVVWGSGAVLAGGTTSGSRAGRHWRSTGWWKSG